MVAKRMGSQGGGSNKTGVTQAQTHDPKSNPLAREGSLYSLTLDEVQNHLGEFLGKPITSMNIDELLKTVSSAAQANNQVMGSSEYATASQMPPGPPGSGSSLNRQSSVTFSRDISQKTVDEVWQDIQQGQKMSSLDRKTTFGEMTLEDFLVKAGVVVESFPGKGNPGSVIGGIDPMGLPQQAQWMNYQVPAVHSQQQSVMPVFMPSGHPVQQAIPLSGNPVMDVGHAETQTSALMGTLSDIQTPGRKRVASGEIVEKSVERRQKRMIKNRESAARSRARKQAYTHELENKVSRLEEENERLKKQKEWENALPTIPPPEPKRQLRRTSSAPI